MRTDQALKIILLRSLDVMLANESGVVEAMDSECLHDFRVALRRSRSVLSQIGGVFPQRVLRRFATGLTWLGKRTGPTRDLHVYLFKLDSYRASLPGTMRPHLLPLQHFLESHLRREQRVLVKTLQSSRYRRLKTGWREFLLAPVPQRSSLSNAGRPVKHTANAHICKAFLKVVKRGRKISRRCPDEKLHKLRIACKKLRYLLECFQQLYPSRKINPLIKPLRQLQTVLGNFQDLSVQIDTLNHMQQQMREENLLSEETHQAMVLLASRLDQQKRALRKQFVDYFAVFADSRNMEKYHELFAPQR